MSDSPSKECPVVFTAEEVNAVLAGKKTQHRVPVLTSEQVAAGYKCCYGVASGQVIFTKDESDKSFVEDGYINVECALGSIGDRLWVQEPTHTANSWDWFYDATHSLVECKDPYTPSDLYLPWDDDHQEYTGPIGAEHMPYWASRLLLEITDIRIERVQDISEHDALAMGLKPDYCDHKYQLCEDIGCIGKWASALMLSLKFDHKIPQVAPETWVWVIEFKKVEG
ncbi:MAG: hypothetical protein ACTHU5_01005 [Psychrobacter sp.]